MLSASSSEEPSTSTTSFSATDPDETPTKYAAGECRQQDSRCAQPEGCLQAAPCVWQALTTILIVSWLSFIRQKVEKVANDHVCGLQMRRVQV